MQVLLIQGLPLALELVLVRASLVLAVCHNRPHHQEACMRQLCTLACLRTVGSRCASAYERCRSYSMRGL